MSGIKAVKTLGADSQDLQRFQAFVQQAWAQVSKMPIINGVLVQNVPLTTGENTVEHKLGRKLLGYIVVGNSADSRIWDSQASNNLPSKTLVLNCSANTTVSLWVF